MVTIMVMGRQPYGLVYAPEVKRHLQAMDRRHYSVIRETMEEQLRFEPRNRKPLQQPALLDAQWELRFGAANQFRVYYEIDLTKRQVHILAIGVKERDRLYVAGEEVEL